MTTRRTGGLAALASRRRGALATLSALAIMVVCGIDTTQDAVANGDTRTITLYHERTQETGSITFRRNGQYDQEALKQLNWMLRDWRTDEATRMDPRLFDIVWQVYREVGAREPIRVMSAYRSPETNAALRRRSRAVAEYSQHILGKALDFHLPDVPMSRVREIGMRLQNGGVGFYPNARHTFVHLDAGSVRSWPRMSGGELARLFPDGRTVHIPRDGKPLPGYEEAKAQILARGGSVAGYTTYAEEDSGSRKSLWASLFGGGGDDEDSDFYRSARSNARAAAPSRQATRVAYASPSYAPAGNSDDAGTRSFFVGAPVEAPPPSVNGREAVVSGRAVPTAETPPPGLEAAAPVASAPMPPRRPADVGPAAPVVARAGAPTVVASAPATPEPRGEMRLPARPAPAAPSEDRAALRTLFEAAVTRTAPDRRADVPTSRTRVQPVAPTAAVIEQSAKLHTVFSFASLDEPRPETFSGPAVAPLPVLR